jgi:hypothetical protein
MLTPPSDILQINDNDRQRILAIIAERLHNYTMAWKYKDFSQLADGERGTNRETLMRPDYELYLRLGGDPNEPLLTIFRSYWSL